MNFLNPIYLAQGAFLTAYNDDDDFGPAPEPSPAPRQSEPPQPMPAPEPRPAPRPAPQPDMTDKNGNVLTQAQVNSLLAQEKRQYQEKQAKLLAELDNLQKVAKLTSQERSQLEERLEVLRNESLTKEELQKKQWEKQRKQWEQQIAESKSTAEQWESRYRESTVNRALIDAANKNDAYNTDQIVAVLRSNTRLVRDLDKDGNPTGDLIPKVQLLDVDEAGEPLTLELNPVDAVKRMREMPQYLNLFRGEGSGGIGLLSQPKQQPTDISKLALDAESYRKAKAEGLIP